MADSGSVNVGSRAVASDLYSPNSEATVGYVQTGSPQPSGFAMNVSVCDFLFVYSLYLVYTCVMSFTVTVKNHKYKNNSCISVYVYCKYDVIVNE